VRGLSRSRSGQLTDEDAGDGDPSSQPLMAHQQLLPASYVTCTFFISFFPAARGIRQRKCVCVYVSVCVLVLLCLCV